jgi:flagellar hook protein FlgE
MDAISIATAGLTRATDRLTASAIRTVAPDADLGREVVEQVQAKTDFKANLAVIRAADEMTGTLLDMLA